jgi:transposase
LRGRSFRSLEEKEGISYGIAQRVLERRLDPEKLVWDEECQAEFSLSIDVHFFRGNKLVQTVNDLSGRRPLTILPDHQKEAMRRFLRNIPDDRKERLREVCIDMDHTLLSVVEEELPEARMVVDHFHVIQDANRRVD